MKNLKFLLFVSVFFGLVICSCTQESDLMVDDQLKSESVDQDLTMRANGKPIKPGGGGSSPLILPLLPGAQSGRAMSINNHGEIVGFSDLSGYRHPTYWSSSTASPEDLGFPDGIPYAIATSISDEGHIVGSTTTINSSTKAIQFRPGPPKVLEPLGAISITYAWEVNNLGVISGSAYNVPNTKRSYGWGLYWKDGMIHDIGKFPDAIKWTVTNGNNDAGTMVGYAVVSDGRNIPFHWNNGNFTGLPYLGQGFGTQVAYDINNNGVIAGACQDENRTIHPVLWEDGQLIDLGIFPGIINGGWAEAVAVNDNGQAVGWGWGEDGYQHALLFKDGKITQLPEPRDAFPPISFAYDINDAGQIVGEASFDGSYKLRPVLWTIGGGGPKKGNGK